MMVFLYKDMNITLWNFGIAKVLYNFRSFYSMMRGRWELLYSLVESALGPQAQLSVASIYIARFLRSPPLHSSLPLSVLYGTGKGWERSGLARHE